MGMFTSLSPARGWNIFMGEKPGKVPKNRWHSLWCYLKGGEIFLAAKESPLPNTVPLTEMRGKRLIAFKKVMVVKKVPTSADLPPLPIHFADLPSHSSLAPVESSSVHFSPSVVNLADESPLPSLPAKRPSEGGTLPRVQQICEDTPFKSNLQCFHAMRPLLLEDQCEGYSQSYDSLEVFGAMGRHLIQVCFQYLYPQFYFTLLPLLILFVCSRAAKADFELARREDRLEEENKYLQTQAPSGKAASLEEELAKLKGELVEGQGINILLNTKKKKLTKDYLGLRKKHEEVTSQQDKLKEESSSFDLQTTQLSGYRDTVVAEASRPTQLLEINEN
ncbi:hypothetical protein LIER_12556 [Lithospermum erythrorhizon]|uniref:Uncharacterized protein n=1 Tax=Lithospermum erythrorhizon TaxID=34254 RepID=A0AAV3PSW7_LITER